MEILRVQGGDDTVAPVIRRIGADDQFAVEMEVNAAAQFERADQLTVAARHQDLRATRLSGGVNGALDGRSIHRDAVTDRAELEDAENILSGP